MKNLILLLTIVLVGCSTTTSNSKTTTPDKLEKKEITYNPSIFSEKDLPVVVVDGPQHRPGSMGEKQTYLTINQPAPYEGVLLNPEGMAYIITEHEALRERADLAVKTQRNLDLNKLNLEVGKLQLELDVTTKKSEIIVKGREDEIARLQTLNNKLIEDSNKPWRKILLLTGGFVVGAAVGVIGTVIVEVSN